MTEAPTTGGPIRCPVRKLEPDGRATGPGVARTTGADGEERWRVTSFAGVRQVLRTATGTRQAGFGGDQLREVQMRSPILYLEGTQHRRQRKASARFFAPAVIEGYRPMMATLAADLVSRVRSDRSTDLSDLSLQMAARVAGRVVGLTSSSATGMARRLNTFFTGDPLTRDRSLHGRLQAARRATAVARFFWLDVKPAIRQRRRRPREDVISQLLEQGFSDVDILTECLTYAAAGMVTTREFIVMAAWHLLDDADLLRRYRAGDRAARADVLAETLRLEPVVGHLLRRTEADLSLATDTGEVVIPAGALVDLDIRAANADPATVGGEPYGLCPGRTLPSAVPAAVMSFGDGHHRCPGGPLALMEAEVFLSALLDRDVVADGPPRVTWNPVSQGYDLRGFGIRLRTGTD
ncbi:MAG: cytochrome [Friedmanniella sp.]|nr:cytochrome [Friedmanniella sp.]